MADATRGSADTTTPLRISIISCPSGFCGTITNDPSFTGG